MITTIHLTADEKKAYETIPAALRDGWTVEDETQTSYETDRQLMMRAHMSTLHKYVVVQEMAQHVMDGKGLPSLGGIPDDLLPEVYFTIGARGVDKLIKLAMQTIKTDEDMEGLASLTMIRHELLLTNANPA
jgi:hypothetical protein